MSARLGLLLYWVGCAAAAVAAVVGAFVFATTDPRPDLLIFFAVIAGLVWVAGRGARYVLAGR